jgi:hypothetical protein
MTTQAQIDANQRNAQLSTGPVTPQGKETASQNATKHALTTNRVLASEILSLEKFFANYMARFMPATEMERGHVRRLSELQVRIDRSIAAETAVIDQNMKIMMEAYPDLTPEDALGKIFMNKESATQMRLVLRYQSQAMRLYKQTLKELEEMIKARLIAAEAEAQAQAELKAQSEKLSRENGFVQQLAPTASAVNQTSIPSRT